MTSRHYCFTINNPDIEWDPDVPLPNDPAGLFNLMDDKVAYCIYAYEIGKEGTPHLQGYIQFNQAVRFARIAKWGGEWARASVPNNGFVKGTAEQNVAYVSKVDDETHVAGPWTYGEMNTQGKRNDINQLVDIIKEDKSLKRVATEMPEMIVKYPRGCEKLMELLDERERDWKTEVIVYWGKAGTGKSRRAYEEGGEKAYFLRKGNGGSIWWDGYEGNENVIIDDFYGWIPWDMLLRICDRYPMTVDIKGGSRKFLAKKIWITSNVHPRDWYNFEKNTNMKYEAFERRITNCIEFE